MKGVRRGARGDEPAVAVPMEQARVVHTVPAHGKLRYE